MSAERFDVIVQGAGPGGEVAVFKLLVRSDDGVVAGVTTGGPLGLHRGGRTARAVNRSGRA